MLVIPNNKATEARTGAVADGFTVVFVKPVQEAPTQPCKRSATHEAVLALSYARVTLVDVMSVLNAHEAPVVSCTLITDDS
jgi:hypothetical protein